MKDAVMLLKKPSLVIVVMNILLSASCTHQKDQVLKDPVMIKKKDSLKTYREKRDFTLSPEPTGKEKAKKGKKPIFVIQKHAARALHYDFRLEIDGVLTSWAIPKGPSLNPADKRLAMPTEDHPMAYGSFEGVIPAGEYGAGTVMVWDTGTYSNLKTIDGKIIPMKECYNKGQIEIILNGEKLQGAFTLVRLHTTDRERWILIKMKDEYANRRKNITTSEPNSALTNRTMAQIKKEEADE